METEVQATGTIAAANSETRPAPSKQYEDALKAVNAAYAVYDKVRQAYRAQTIGDAEFLEAQKVYRAAEAAFDAAFALEAGHC